MLSIRLYCSTFVCIFYYILDAEGTDKDTLEYELKIKCTLNKELKNVEGEDAYINSKGMLLVNMLLFYTESFICSIFKAY